ncbi:hypothetical protein DHEL01_v208181 [Diaporthe helianthi]|uniref:Uncharacterized protein n=1 Tax=Diaporthe helianthi TaxID=158607 RepID=A0A2P5HT53_DIAHE|nr:hypothetical protein DHEL01_v208181 [Diaporthe helianthi]
MGLSTISQSFRQGKWTSFLPPEVCWTLADGRRAMMSGRRPGAWVVGRQDVIAIVVAFNVRAEIEGISPQWTTRGFFQQALSEEGERAPPFSTTRRHSLGNVGPHLA